MMLSLRATTIALLVIGPCDSLSTQKLSTNKANSWQRRIDRVLFDVDLKGQARFRTLQRALADPDILKDISKGVNAVREKGFGKGHPELIEALWPEGTIARSDIEGIQALTKSLPERIDELRNDKEDSASSAVTDISDVVKSTKDAVQGSDANAVASAAFTRVRENPQRALKLVQNTLRREPKEVEILPSEFVRNIVKKDDDGNDVTVGAVRKFNEFTAVACSLDTSEEYSLSNMGGALTKLSSYLVLGNNEEKTIMEMTAPFIMQDNEMYLKVPTKYGESDSLPTPASDSGVRIQKIPSKLLATLEFSGICTNAEVERQKDALINAIVEEWESEPASATTLDIVSSPHVFQYNAPGTLPWRRKNLIAVEVVENTPVVAEEKAISAEEKEEVIQEGKDVDKDVTIVAEEAVATEEKGDAAATNTGEENVIVAAEKEASNVDDDKKSKTDDDKNDSDKSDESIN